MILDSEAEAFLSVTNNYRFLLALMAAFRSGRPQTTQFNGTTQVSTVTSFIYRDTTNHIGLLVNYLTNTAYGYNYTVSAWSGAPTPAWTPITSGSGTGIDFNGSATGDSFVLVAWA
jgi:hypothetical protein